MSTDQAIVTIVGSVLSTAAAYFSASTRSAVAELRNEVTREMSDLKVDLAKNYVRKDEVREQGRLH